MGNDCSNLQEFNDACKMGECVSGVTGLKSNTESPTDSWLIKYKNNTRYDNISITKGFIKWWIDPVTLLHTNKDDISKLTIQILNGLDYEINVYKDVIRILIDYNICPNFVRYLGSSKRCKIVDLGKILLGKTKDTNGDILTETQIQKNLVRNLTYMVNLIKGRPSINNLKEEKFEGNIIEPSDKWEYNFLVNTPTEPGTIESGEFFTKYMEHEKPILQLIFQVIAACYAMYLSKMSHNDMHLGNIWVTPVDKTVIYLYDEQIYGFKSLIDVKVYDFDRSYVKAFGDNKILTPHLANYNQTNSLIDNRDMIKFLGDVYTISSSKIKDIILNIVLQNRYYQNNTIILKVDKILKSGYTLDVNKLPLPENDYKTLFKTPEEILSGFGNKIKDFDRISDIRTINKDDIFICNKSIFNQNGRVIIDKKTDIKIDQLICNSQLAFLEQENNKLKNILSKSKI